jgi:hypothetical protein
LISVLTPSDEIENIFKSFTVGALGALYTSCSLSVVHSGDDCGLLADVEKGQAINRLSLFLASPFLPKCKVQGFKPKTVRLLISNPGFIRIAMFKISGRRFPIQKKDVGVTFRILSVDGSAVSGRSLLPYIKVILCSILRGHRIKLTYQYTIACIFIPLSQFFEHQFGYVTE